MHHSPARVSLRAICLSAFCSLVMFPFACGTCAFSQEHAVASFVKISDDDVRVSINGDFFAEYRSDFRGTPIVWPICAPNGALATRAWPMIEAVKPEDESDPVMKDVYRNAVISERKGVKDHPHHRSFWFNHGNVNNGDFWGGTKATIRQTALREVGTVENMNGTAVKLVSENAWFNDKQNRDVCKDVRTVLFGAFRTKSGKDVRYIDFKVVIEPLEDGVIFGDTKEGSFGIRVPSPMNVTSKKINPNWGGSILNDAGEKDGATWSKQSRWVNYTGPVERFLKDDELDRVFKDEKGDFPLDQAGIAVIDGTSSLGKHPWRHVRDYGLFASNPFGQHDFEPQNPKADGSKKLNKGDTLAFSFLTLFHDGSLTVEELNEICDEYVGESK